MSSQVARGGMARVPGETGESFHSRFRDECLALEQFTTCDEAKVVVRRWQEGYNERRPHSSLDGQAPKEFAAAWATSVRATPSLQQPKTQSPTQTAPS